MALNKILDDFGPCPRGTLTREHAKPVTIWIPNEAKVRFDRLQEMSGRQFSKKAREALLVLIEMAEARTG